LLRRKRDAEARQAQEFFLSPFQTLEKQQAAADLGFDLGAGRVGRGGIRHGGRVDRHGGSVLDVAAEGIELAGDEVDLFRGEEARAAAFDSEGDVLGVHHRHGAASLGFDIPTGQGEDRLHRGIDARAGEDKALQPLCLGHGLVETLRFLAPGPNQLLAIEGDDVFRVAGASFALAAGFDLDDRDTRGADRDVIEVKLAFGALGRNVVKDAIAPGEESWSRESELLPWNE